MCCFYWKKGGSWLQEGPTLSLTWVYLCRVFFKTSCWGQVDRWPGNREEGEQETTEGIKHTNKKPTPWSWKQLIEVTILHGLTSSHWVLLPGSSTMSQEVPQTKNRACRTRASEQWALRAKTWSLSSANLFHDLLCVANQTQLCSLPQFTITKRNVPGNYEKQSKPRLLDIGGRFITVDITQ